MELIKGDKLKQVKEIKGQNGFSFVGKVFTVTNVLDDCILLRGKISELFPYATVVEGDNDFDFSVSKKIFENNETIYFEKVHIWTPWRKLRDKNGVLSDFTITEMLYKTNRKIIWLKINDDKIKVTCHKNDVFDLKTGLEIGMKRWIEKQDNQKTVAHGSSENSPIIFKERSCNLFDMPIYYNIAHCVSTDYNLAGYTARTIDECYNMKTRFLNTINHGFSLGDSVYIDNVFNLITNEPYKKMDKDTLRDCVQDMATLCNEFGVIHLAIPHFGTRKGNLDWEEVKQIIIEEFTEVYMRSGWNHSIEIVACDNNEDDLINYSILNKTINTTTNTTINTAPSFDNLDTTWKIVF